jgi:dihydroorotate dehydrogenase (NAD+) catalytic subunit
VTIFLTNPGKQSLMIDKPVMNAAGILGFAAEASGLIPLDALGAFVTNPITYAPRTSSGGTRAVALDAGLLLTTGLPNTGMRKMIEAYRAPWSRMPVPVIVHVAATSAADLISCLELLDREDSVAGVEVGVQDDLTAKEAAALVKAVVRRTDKPLIFRLPFGAPLTYAQAVEAEGIGGLTLGAAPRGVARDPGGRWVTGRIYGPMVHAMNLHHVNQIAKKVNIPVTASGGIHTADHARDYLQVGAAAVQVDSVAWARPSQVAIIARDLAGLTTTQPVGALPDEWFPGMTDADKKRGPG